MHQSLPPGISLVTADGFKEWHMDICVLDPNPLYLNQTYRLRFRFSTNYPIGTSPRPVLNCLVAPHILSTPLPTPTIISFLFLALH